MYIIIICWGMMKCDLVDLLNILLGLEHTCQSDYIQKINDFSCIGGPYLIN